MGYEKLINTPKQIDLNIMIVMSFVKRHCMKWRSIECPVMKIDPTVTD